MTLCVCDREPVVGECCCHLLECMGVMCAAGILLYTLRHDRVMRTAIVDNIHTDPVRIMRCQSFCLPFTLSGYHHAVQSIIIILSTFHSFALFQKEINQHQQSSGHDEYTKYKESNVVCSCTVWTFLGHIEDNLRQN